MGAVRGDGQRHQRGEGQHADGDVGPLDDVRPDRGEVEPLIEQQIDRKMQGCVVEGEQADGAAVADEIGPAQAPQGRDGEARDQDSAAPTRRAPAPASSGDRRRAGPWRLNRRTRPPAPCRQRRWRAAPDRRRAPGAPVACGGAGQRPSLEVGFQVHAGIEARHLIGIAVEGQRLLALGEQPAAADAALGGLAPARMVDGRD